MSGISFNNSAYSPKNAQNAINSLNSVNKDLAAQTTKVSTGKSVNSAEEDAVSISKSAKLQGQMAAYEQSLSTADSASKEDQIGESLVALASANSTVIDTDMAKEQSEQIRLKIQQEMTTAALSQANLEFGQVFKMLG